VGVVAGVVAAGVEAVDAEDDVVFEDDELPQPATASNVTVAASAPARRGLDARDCSLAITGFVLQSFGLVLCKDTARTGTFRLR
jgi:hypothetical protein